MRVKDLVRTLPDCMTIKIYHQYRPTWCSHSQASDMCDIYGDIYGEDCNDCEHFERTQEISTDCYFNGYAQDVPLRLSEKRIIRVDVEAGKKRKEYLLAVEVWND